MESRQGQTDDYAPPLPPRPPKQKNNVCENIHDLWTKIPQQLQPIVKISLIVLGCILALVIAFLIGYDAAKSKYHIVKTSETSSVQTTENTQVLSQPCDKSYPDPSDCSRYFQCLSGYLLPEGTILLLVLEVEPLGANNTSSTNKLVDFYVKLNNMKSQTLSNSIDLYEVPLRFHTS